MLKLLRALTLRASREKEGVKNCTRLLLFSQWNISVFADFVCFVSFVSFVLLVASCSLLAWLVYTFYLCAIGWLTNRLANRLADQPAGVDSQMEPRLSKLSVTENPRAQHCPNPALWRSGTPAFPLQGSKAPLPLGQPSSGGHPSCRCQSHPLLRAVTHFSPRIDSLVPVMLGRFSRLPGIRRKIHNVWHAGGLLHSYSYSSNIHFNKPEL